MTGRQGRPHNPAPKLAFEVRRYMTLVQVLAMGDFDSILTLYEAWELPKPEPDVLLMITRLAQHVVEYHRSE